MKKYIFLNVFIFMSITWVILASTNPTIRFTIDGWKIAEGPYNNDILAWTWADALRIMRTGSENWLGDYILGSFYDSAYGRFTLPAVSDSHTVTITSNSYTGCDDWFTWRMLTGRAQTTFFWSVDFSNVHICIPNTVGQLNQETDIDQARLWWFIRNSAGTDFIWVQNVYFELDASTFLVDDTSNRRLKIIGLASSQNFNTFDADQLSEVRVFWDISKPELRALMQRNVQMMTRNLTTSIPSSWVITNLSWASWDSWVSWISLSNNQVRYFRYTWDASEEVAVPRVRISWSNLSWNKTLVVDGANVYIDGNITWDGILWIIALQRNGRGGNIYIRNTVTDIHAMMYADRSVMSARTIWTTFEELNGNSHEERLLNQLYIKGVLFSENTIGGANTPPYNCPFFVRETCDISRAALYDLNYLRRYYIAESFDTDGNLISIPTGTQAAGIAGRETELGVYPVILEYDSRISNTPPALFTR